MKLTEGSEALCGLHNVVSGHTVAKTTLREGPDPVPLLPHTEAASRNTAHLLPGHFLCLLPGGGHLDHVPQQGQPSFFDQQGAVLVGCGEGQTSRSAQTSSSLGPRTHPCCEGHPP